MLMIIGHHLALYGAPCDDPSYISPNILLCQFIQGGGKLGDNIFILITGYFSITTDKVNYLKIYRLWKQMVFFMLVDYFIAAAAGYTSFSFLSFLSCLFPMMTGQYGFVTGYVTLLLFVPYLNRLLQSLSFREYGVFLISYFLVYGLLPSLGFAWVVGFSNIIWFVFIYSMGALFKLYGSKFCRSAKQYGLHALFWLFLTVSAVLIIDLVNTHFPPLWFDLTQFYNLYSLNIILLSADLFLFFAKKPPFQNKTINGTLEEDTMLPSIRSLAKELRISIITTKRAYEELERDGFVYTIAGKGVFVARKNTEVLREEWLRQIESHMEAIATLAKGCGLSKADLQEMLNMIYEEDASCNMLSK